MSNSYWTEVVFSLESKKDDTGALRNFMYATPSPAPGITAKCGALVNDSSCSTVVNAEGFEWVLINGYLQTSKRYLIETNQDFGDFTPIDILSIQLIKES